MTYPIIGYDNLLEAGTVTATDEATGYAKENAWDWLACDWWKPASTGTKYLTVDLGSGVTEKCDYLGIASHTLGTTGATITLQYSADNVTWNDCHTANAPTHDRPLVLFFTQRNVRYYRLKVVTGATVPVLGIVSFGEALQMPRHMVPGGFRPLHLGREYDNLTSLSATGVFLGRSVRQVGASGVLKFELLSPSWVRAYWEPFLSHAVAKPWFWLWDPDNYPGEAALCWTTSKDQDGPSYSNPLYMSIDLRVRAMTQ